jgi:acyl-CoA reductase-like NAD-dependent aldehyde dehydrogenase
MKVDHSMEIMHGECFGPLAPIARVMDLSEAIHIANDSELGLGANIYTNELSESARAVREIETGIVWVNTWLNRDLRTPFGGVKQSGVGREGGIEALRFFTEPKNICIQV